MKKHVLFLFATLLSLAASAQEFKVNGNSYYITSETDKTVRLTLGRIDYSITIPATVTYNGVNYSVTSIGDWAFAGFSKLTSITLPESVTSIGDRAFEDCSSLTAINIPEGVTSIESSAFSGCSSLTSITIPEGVTSIGDYAFWGCSSLKSITIPEGVTSIGSYAFSDCSSLTTITIPEDSKLTIIGRDAFSYCSSLTAITLPKSVTYIGWYAFMYCSSLTAITIPESVTSIESSTFSSCSSLTSITLPESVTSIESGAFWSCSSLTSITLPESVTSIGDYAFEGCSSLTTITIPEGVTSFGDVAFYGCSSLERVTINCAYVGNWFSGLSSIKEIVLGASVTSIGWDAFHGCSSLTAINIPESVTSIGDETFYDCSKLTSITIPEGVTSIGYYTFYGCSSLTSIVLPKSVALISSEAFAYCSGLTDVYCYAETVPTTEANAFNGSDIEHATLHVPASAINSYKSTAPWSGFGKFETTSIPVESITLSRSSATLTEGENLTLTAMVAPDDATDKSISWSSSNPSVATVDNTGKVTAIAPGTATITATANDGSGVSAQCEVTVTPASYVITFLVDGEVILTNTLTRGSTINLPDVPAKEGYTFSGWSEVPETMPAKNVTVSGTFIINKYLVTFKIDDVVFASYSLEYGATITLPSTPPTREGYTFSGWGEVAETVPANDVTYSAYYIANVYKVHYFVGSKLVNMVEVTYGEPIPEYIYEPTTEGDEFLGWIGDTYETMPAHDVIYTANIYNGIDVMSTNNSQQSKVFYDLTGRRVTNPIRGGIYIINGRKVMIK